MECRFKHLLLRRMAALVLAVFGTCAARAAIGPNTIMDDVPGTTTISNVVSVGETDPTVAAWAKQGQPKPSGGGADTNTVNALIEAYDATNLTARIAAKRDKADNVCHATVYGGRLTASGVPSGVTLEDQPILVNGPEEGYYGLEWRETDYETTSLYWFTSYMTLEAIETTNPLTFTDVTSIRSDFTATRSAIAVSNESFVTSSFVTNAAESIVESASVTNGGAKAYAEANFEKKFEVGGGLAMVEAHTVQRLTYKTTLPTGWPEFLYANVTGTTFAVFSDDALMSRFGAAVHVEVKDYTITHAGVSELFTIWNESQYPKSFSRTLSADTATITNIAGRVTSNVVTKSFVDGLGISGGNVLHYSRSTATFAETPMQVVAFVQEKKPVYCLVDDYLWFGMDNVVTQEVSGVKYYTLSLSCRNPSNMASGIYTPWLMTAICAPSINYVLAQIGQARTLADSYVMLTNSANFKRAVSTMLEGTTDRITNETSVITAGGKIITRASTNETTWTTNTLLSTDSHAVTRIKDYDNDEYTVVDIANHPNGRGMSDGVYGFSAGYMSQAFGSYTAAFGFKANANSEYTFVWNGISTKSYADCGNGTFCINPVGGTSGFYIGDSSMNTLLGNYVPTTRKIANKVLSADVTLGTLTVGSQTYNGSADVSLDLSGYVQTSRKVNGKALNADITITKDDLGIDETKVWNTNGVSFISGDLGVYQKEIVNFTWTGGVSQASWLPSFLVFSKTGTDLWTATSGGDNYSLSREDEQFLGEIMSRYTLLKNGEDLPQNSSVIGDDDVEMDICGGAITLYKKVLSYSTNRIDILATQTDVGKIQSNTNIEMRIDGSALIISTNGTTVWRGESATVSGRKRYALFLLHLNPGSATHPFMDIELKGTTNNFYHSGSYDSMMFYCASSVNGDPQMSGNPEWAHDWCRIYILSSVVDSDVRKWRRIRNTGDLGSYQPRDLAIIVDPALFRRSQGSEWCNDANDMLTWSYVRITASGPELDEDGVHQLWRPIMPVRWYATLPGWADQDSWESE